MGLFDIFRKNTDISKNVQQELYNKNLYGCRDIKDSLSYQDKLLSLVNDASERYEQDHDLDAVIKAFEQAFVEADQPCKSSQNMKLADYYIKAGLNDKAWGYLNKLQLTSEAPLEKIRFAQSRILKKKKKYINALEYCLMGHFNKYSFNENVFYKDLMSYSNKLNLDYSQISYLKQIITSSKNESALIDKYRSIIKDWRLI